MHETRTEVESKTRGNAIGPKFGPPKDEKEMSDVAELGQISPGCNIIQRSQLAFFTGLPRDLHPLSAF